MRTDIMTLFLLTKGAFIVQSCFSNDEVDCRSDWTWLFHYCLTLHNGQLLDHPTTDSIWSSLDKVLLSIAEQIWYRLKKLFLYKGSHLFAYIYMVSIILRNNDNLLASVWVQVDNDTNTCDCQQKKKRTCRIVDFAIPVDLRAKVKESEKR